jgi:hypothetical protein
MSDNRVGVSVCGSGIGISFVGGNRSVWIWRVSVVIGFLSLLDFCRYWISVLSLPLYMPTVQDWALQLAFSFCTSSQAFVLDYYNAYWYTICWLPALIAMMLGSDTAGSGSFRVFYRLQGIFSPALPRTQLKYLVYFLYFHDLLKPLHNCLFQCFLISVIALIE